MWLTPHEKRERRVRRLWVLLALSVGMLVFTLLDTWLWRITLVKDRGWLGRQEWYQALRQLGYLPIWGCIGLMVILTRWKKLRREATAARPFDIHSALRPGLAVFLAAGLGGLAAEIWRPIVLRHRPGTTGEYRFGWDLLGGKVEGLGYGFASSHAGVIFGGAFAVAYLLPGSGWVILPLAFGCALTRMWMGAHYATDIYFAVVLSYAVARLLRPWLRPETPPGLHGPT